MIGVEAAIAKGYAAYKRGDLEAARAALTPVEHPQAWQILGLVERQAGRLEQAALWLGRAQKADPRNPEILNNLGRVALDRGAASEAEAHFRAALDLRADWEPALTGLARSLNEQRKWHAAGAVWQEALRLKPTDPGVQFGAATAALETGRLDEAEAVYSGLIARGVKDAAVYFMRGRCRLEASRIGEGLEDLTIAWRLRPEAHVLRNLANSLWMMGDETRFSALLASVPPGLAVMAVDIRGQSGDLSGALAAWDRLPESYRTSPHALAVKATLHRDLSETQASSSAAEAAYKLAPNDPFIIEAVICARLMRGDGAAALAVISPVRLQEPMSQSWLAYEATALRLMGDPRYQVLVNLDAHVRAYDLPVPDGFTSIESFNQAFAAALEPVRGFTTHPLDQSLRLGAQTSRDLVTTPDPVIQAYIKALDAPIRAYIADIGAAAGHPLTERNRGTYRFNGCWSVKLSGGGRHVNHIHSQGWISSAYYAQVPAETRAGGDRAGWIKFGEPPFVTEPATPPQKWVQPEAGLLVLFPSYLWHGTEPIRAGSTRITAPFDVVPG